MAIKNINIDQIQNKDIKRFWSKVTILSKEECWLWHGSTTKTYYRKGTIKQIAENKQYGVFKLFINRRHVSVRANRFAYFLTYNPENFDHFSILHNCDNPNCVSPYHLRLGNQQENMKDMVDKKRQAFGKENGKHTHPEKVQKGSQVGTAKLTETQVIQLRQLHQEKKYTIGQLAKLFSISTTTTYRIIKRMMWQHI